jgi:cyclic nucleotide gated channel
MKETNEVKEKENIMMMATNVKYYENDDTQYFSAPLQVPMGSSYPMYSGKLVGNLRRGRSMRYGSELDILGGLRKPIDPDFNDDDDG